MPETVLTGGVPSIPEFRPVSASVFDERASRLRDLARGHPMEEYLRFAAALARAQAASIDFQKEIEMPPHSEVEHCRKHGLPALSIDSPRQAVWQQGLHLLLDSLPENALPLRAQRVAKNLRVADRDSVERDASQLLAGAYSGIDPGRMPFIGAALQLYWTRMACALGDDGRSPDVDSRLCPVCGSPPSVSVVRVGGAQQGLRFLVCSLCASEWHLVRVKCSDCNATENISYLFVDGANDAVRAECCDDCNTYLKILYFEKDQHVEPVADDLASLALDMLVDEQGYRRLGPNLLLAPGAG